MTSNTSDHIQSPSFLTTLQSSIAILDDISTQIDDNTYLTLVNYLQQLYSIHTSSTGSTGSTGTTPSPSIYFSHPVNYTNNDYSNYSQYRNTYSSNNYVTTSRYSTNYDVSGNNQNNISDNNNRNDININNFNSTSISLPFIRHWQPE